MVEWGLVRRELTGIRALGIDEVLFHRGHRYLTVFPCSHQGHQV